MATQFPERNAPRSTDYHFVFTRDTRSDYQFAVWPMGWTGVAEAIVLLQDYFPHLIDGHGYFSFPVGTAWVTAEVVRTERLDHVQRPIYEIRGWIHDQASLGPAWYRFASALDSGEARARPQFGRVRPEALTGEFPAQPAQVARFLLACPAAPAPIAWAYGVCREASDTTGLPFQVRFIAVAKPAPEPTAPGWTERVRRWVRWFGLGVFVLGVPACWLFASFENALTVTALAVGLPVAYWLLRE